MWLLQFVMQLLQCVMWLLQCDAAVAVCYVIVVLCDVILAGLEEEGIYRKAATNSRVDNRIQELKTGQSLSTLLVALSSASSWLQSE